MHLAQLAGVGIALVAAADAVQAHTVRQRLGAYTDSEGLSRQRVGYDVAIDGPDKGPSGLSGSTFGFAVRRDRFQRSDMSEQDFERQAYGGSTHYSDQAALSAGQTWDRVTETRVLASYATDGAVSVRTVSTGISQWMRHETLRLSFDLTRTLLQQPLFEVLDYDSQTIANPTVSTSSGATIGVRHLATPTTMVDYTVLRVEAANRPPATTGAIGIRQFVPPLAGALHWQSARAYNRGYVATDTTYGQVDAWIHEAAWVQNLWKGGLGRLSYRYYKESETTRAYEDEKVFGSDTLSAGLTQELPRGAVVGVKTPVTVEAAYARYLTNVAVAASSLEVGLGAKF